MGHAVWFGAGWFRLVWVGLVWFGLVLVLVWFWFWFGLGWFGLIYCWTGTIEGTGPKSRQPPSTVDATIQYPRGTSDRRSPQDDALRPAAKLGHLCPATKLGQSSDWSESSPSVVSAIAASCWCISSISSLKCSLMQVARSCWYKGEPVRLMHSTAALLRMLVNQLQCCADRQSPTYCMPRLRHARAIAPDPGE